VFTSFDFLSREKKMLGEKIVSLRSPPSIYIHMCTLYTYTNICMPRFSPSGFFGLSRCLILTPGLTSEYPICTVCVCVRIHTSFFFRIRHCAPVVQTQVPTLCTDLNLGLHYILIFETHSKFFFSEFATALQFSKRKYRRCAQT